MVDLFYSYVLYGYGIPISMYLVICLLLWVMGYRARWYIVESIIGLSWISKDKDKTKVQPNEKTVEKFFYVEGDDEIENKSFPENMHWRMKLLCFFYTSAILGLFLAIIFEKCVLSYTVIHINQKCPFNGDCFYKRTEHYTCQKDQTANFSSSTNGTLACFGWVIQDQDAEAFIDAIGITGGLLGIISSIVPTIYYISTSVKWRRDRKIKNSSWNDNSSDHCSKAFVIIMMMLPILPAAMLIFIGIYTIPVAPSMTTILSFIIVFLMASTAWIWAVYTVFQCSCGSKLCNYCDTNKIPFCCFRHKYKGERAELFDLEQF
jgi:hypothetical protein